MASHDIIFIAAEPWEHYTWRRRHHVAWNLAKNNRVLFVEPPLTFLNPFRDIDLNWRHLLNLGRLKHQGKNLYSYSPARLFPLSLPGSGRFKYYERDRQRIFKNLKNSIKKLKFKDPILWVYMDKYQYDYHGLFNEKIRITDWYDKFTAYSGIELQPGQIVSGKDREQKLLKNSDIIFAVSEELRKDLAHTGKSVYVIPQGVDYESFQNNQNRKKGIKRYLENIERPILGFIGIMHYIVDFKLLTYMAEKRPAWSILLLGKKWLTNESDSILFHNLINKDNVHYLGEKPREELPAYLSGVDVCLMPMKRTELNRKAAPLKLWEYLAAGKPIVAVDQGIRYDCDQFIEVAKGKDGLIAKIEECLKEGKNEELVQKRKQIAKNNSWESRTKQMMEIIESHLNDRNQINNTS